MLLKNELINNFVGPSDSTENAKEKKHKSGKRFLEESSEWKSEITGNIKSENVSSIHYNL